MTIFLCVLYVIAVLINGYYFVVQDALQYENVKVSNLIYCIALSVIPVLNFIVLAILLWILCSSTYFKNPFYKQK